MLDLRPLFLIFLLALSLPSPTFSIRSVPENEHLQNSSPSVQFLEAPEYRNGPQCPLAPSNNLSSSVCDPSLVHIAMTIDSQYLRGSVAAVHSILKHTFCPENVFFHLVAGKSSSSSSLATTIKSTFPSLKFKFKFYTFNESLVTGLISSSIRRALEHPLNYARIHLATILEPCVARVIYLDSDVVLVDDVKTLWSTALTGSRAIGAPEYCHVDVRSYFSGGFWADPGLYEEFESKRACYFNTGVMVMDLGRWREGEYSNKIERWMEVQRERRIYELGSLPPFLLVFGGEVEAIGHRWNQHGLGGDNVEGRCRGLHPGPVSLLHWSGKGKPWERLDEGRACPVDYLWAPYDLYNHDRLLGKRRDH